MGIDRRAFTAGVLSFLAGINPSRAAKLGGERSVIAATTRHGDGRFSAVLYDLDKSILNIASLPARGHDIAVNPVTRQCVAFARRPGNFAVAFGLDRRDPPIAFEAPRGRHFYGHGIFSPDGRLLYTTENDINSGAGVIGIWDPTSNYQRVGEISAHGIGPHDINLLSDPRTLVIANGGIRTHPDHGRKPLNLRTMSPSLVYVDRLTGDLIERATLPPGLHHTSIRHLDVGVNDTIVFGCQNKGPRTRWVDLVGFHRRGAEIELLPGQPDLHRALRHYVSSVAVDRSGDYCAITSSRGQQVVIVDIMQRRVMHTHAFGDVSGGASGSKVGEFALTNGSGGLGVLPHAQGAIESVGTVDWSWDNHAVRVI